MIFSKVNGKISGLDGMREKLYNLRNGKYVMVVKPLRMPASHSQVKFWKGILCKVVALEWGVEWEVADSIIKKRFIPKEIILPDGTRHVEAGHITDLNTKELSTLVDEVRNWLMQEHNIVVKTPDQWRQDEFYKLQDYYNNRYL